MRINRLLSVSRSRTIRLSCIPRTRPRRCGSCRLASSPGSRVARASDGAASFVDVARQVQPKVVKIYGAGGDRGLKLTRAAS